MYINPCVAGVLATLLAETIIFIGIMIYCAAKKNNGGRK